MRFECLEGFLRLLHPSRILADIQDPEKEEIAILPGGGLDLILQETNGLIWLPFPFQQEGARNDESEVSRGEVGGVEEILTGDRETSPLGEEIPRCR